MNSMIRAAAAQAAANIEPVSAETLLTAIRHALDEGKAHDVQVIDLQGKAAFADYMVVATGSSTRHVKSLADRVEEEVRTRWHIKPIGVEGEQSCEWVLVDFGDVVLHVMLGPVREFYQLEKLWSAPEAPPRPDLRLFRGD